MPTQTQTRWPLCTSTSVYGDCPCLSGLNNRFEWHRESWSGIRPNLRGLSPKPLLCVFVNRNMVPWDCLSACQPVVSYMPSESSLYLKYALVCVSVSVSDYTVGPVWVTWWLLLPDVHPFLLLSNVPKCNANKELMSPSHPESFTQVSVSASVSLCVWIDKWFDLGVLCIPLFALPL